MILHFTKNPFANPEISEDKFDNLSLTHINRLETNNQNGDFAALIAATRPLYDDFHASLTIEALDRSLKEGKTITVDGAVRLLKQFASGHQVDIAFHFREGTATYEEFYPLGVSEYLRSNKKNILRLFERFKGVIQLHTDVLGNAMLTELQQKLDAFRTGRNFQLQAIGEVLEQDSESNVKRRALAIQLYRNLGTLVTMFADNPQRIIDFFLQVRSRKPGEAPVPPPPAASSIILLSDQTILHPISIDFIGFTAGDIVNIAFGDGQTTVHTLQTGTFAGNPHTYIAAGMYTISVSGALVKIHSIRTGNGRFTSITIPEGMNPQWIEVGNNPLLTNLTISSSNTNLNFLDASGCALPAGNINTILLTINGLDTSGGTIFIHGGTNAAPTGQGIAAKNQLISRGWTVITN
mgnify:CR=1 FL=1